MFYLLKMKYFRLNKSYNLSLLRRFFIIFNQILWNIFILIQNS